MVALIMMARMISAAEPIDYQNQSSWDGECQDNDGEQSPIDIRVSGNDFIAEYDDVKVLKIVANTIPNVKRVTTKGKYFDFVYNVVVNNYVTIEKNGDEYRFDIHNIHLHCPSEHAINGVTYDCVLHLVHKRDIKETDKDKDRPYLVIGLLIEGDGATDSPLFSSNELDFSPYINDKTNFYYYEGGLTTPSCLEVVNWFVSDSPIKVSTAQINELKSWVNTVYPTTGNDRVVQPLEGRKVYYIKGEGNNTGKILTVAYVISFLSVLLLF